MKTIKRAYYAFMYEVTDAIAWWAIAGYGGNGELFAKFWRISGNYRIKRDAVG